MAFLFFFFFFLFLFFFLPPRADPFGRPERTGNVPFWGGQRGLEVKEKQLMAELFWGGQMGREARREKGVSRLKSRTAEQKGKDELGREEARTRAGGVAEPS